MRTEEEKKEKKGKCIIAINLKVNYRYYIMMIHYIIILNYR